MGEGTATTQKKGFNKIIIPIMSIFALGASQGGVNAGMATISAAFPEAGAGVAYVISMVALGMIPAGALSGLITGRFIKYKTSIIIAIVAYIVSGLWPFFMTNEATFNSLLISRFIFGFAVGWSYPLASALTFKTYHDEQKRASILGMGMAFFNIGTMIMELGGGYLALISWQACFLVYAIGIIPLIAVIFLMKEPEKDSKQAEEMAAKTGEQVKTKIPGIAWIYLLLLTLVVLFCMPTVLYCSMVIEMSGMGDSVTAGWLLTGMTVVGMVSGFTLGPCYKKLGKWLLPIAGLVVGGLYLVAAIASTPGSANFAVYAVAFLVGHWGFAIVIPGTSNMLTNIVPIGAATRAMGFYSAFHQAGCFLAAPVAVAMMPLIQATTVHDLLVPCSVIVMICAVLQFVLAAFTKMNKYQSQDAAQIADTTNVAEKV